jgi:predicted DNA-binding transcriptional regulator AlpA
MKEDLSLSASESLSTAEIGFSFFIVSRCRATTKTRCSLMIETNPDILLSKEVEREVRLSAATIWRLQKAGRFPRYFKLSPRKNAAHRAQIEDYKRDPENWRPASQ